MILDPVQQVRRFNRVVSQRIGALEDSYLQRGRPLGEARMLYEIGAEGADLRALRERLGLDSGYASRLLRSLEAQGLVRVGASAQDGRRRRVSLTPNGRAELKTYDRRSDALAEAMLTPLSATQRDRLLAAMTEVERLIRAAAVEIRLEPPGSADARQCLEAYFSELAARFEEGFEPRQSISEREQELTPPAGYLFVARLDGRAVGCGALKVDDGKSGEIKRVWIAEAVRGLGLGRRILGTLEGKARELGLATLRLDTNRVLHEAQRLYRTSGYRDIDRFNDNPYAHHWFEKRL
jgi:DNA-binding MarR family transcriptional regulator/GNAT superfamily N-acetyltransferase